MSREWIHPHSISLLPRRSVNVRSIVTVLMATAEYIYGLKGKEYIRIPRQFFVLCRNIIFFLLSDARNIVITESICIDIPICLRETFTQNVPIKNG
jgi:hypothetical protein